MGRPSSFTEVVADEICRRLTGGESLRKICEGEDMPSQPTVFRWMADQPEFRKKYAHAREGQADAYFDRVLHEAETATDAGLGRLKVDALKWAASKLAPKKYGDKVEVEHSGEVAMLSGDQLDAKIAALSARLNEPSAQG